MVAYVPDLIWSCMGQIKRGWISPAWYEFCCWWIKKSLRMCPLLNILKKQQHINICLFKKLMYRWWAFAFYQVTFPDVVGSINSSLQFSSPHQGWFECSPPAVSESSDAIALWSILPWQAWDPKGLSAMTGMLR